MRAARGGEVVGWRVCPASLQLGSKRGRQTGGVIAGSRSAARASQDHPSHSRFNKCLLPRTGTAADTNLSPPYSDWRTSVRSIFCDQPVSLLTPPTRASPLVAHAASRLHGAVLAGCHRPQAATTRLRCAFPAAPRRSSAPPPTAYPAPAPALARAPAPAAAPARARATAQQASNLSC